MVNLLARGPEKGMTAYLDSKRLGTVTGVTKAWDTSSTMVYLRDEKNNLEGPLLADELVFNWDGWWEERCEDNCRCPVCNRKDYVLGRITPDEMDKRDKKYWANKARTR